MIFLVVCVALIVVVAGIWFLQRSRNLQGPVNEKEENSLPVRSRKKEEFVRLTYVYMAAWVIGKNSRDSQEKIRFAHAFFEEKFGNTTSETVDELVKALRNSTNIRNVAAWIVRHMQTAEERTSLIRFLIDLSFVDGDIIDREYVAIGRFAELTGVNVRYVADEIHLRRKAIYEDYSGDKQIDLIANGTFFRRRALFLLDLTDGATKEEIRKAYKRLAAQLHPDKFATEPEEAQKKAAEKFMEIKDAYHFLR